MNNSTAYNKTHKAILRRMVNLFDWSMGAGISAASTRGVVISTAGFGTQKLLQFVSNLILTRLLYPEAFGLMTICSVFMIGIAMFTDLGINAAIIRSNRGDDETFNNTAWTIKIFRGIIIFFITCALAWPVSKLYDQPILFHMLCAMGTVAILQGLCSNAIATLNRHLEFRKIAIVDLLQTVVSVFSTVILAYYFHNVWSLVFGAILGDAFRTILSHWYLSERKHRLLWDKDSAIEIFKFGSWIVLATVVSFAGSHGLSLVQGLLIPMEVLGLLAVARVFTASIDQLFAKLFNTVGLSTLSKIIRDDFKKFNTFVWKVRAISNIAGFSAYFSIAILGGFAIDHLYDARYTEVKHYLYIMALNGAIGYACLFYQSAQLALGNSRTHFVVMLIGAIARVACLIGGFYIKGVDGMLIGICFGSFIAYIASVTMSFRRGFACINVDASYFLGVIFFGYWLIV